MSQSLAKCNAASVLGGLFLAAAALATPLAAHAQQGSLNVPKSIAAGSAFSIPTSGSGKATLYIVGPSQVLKHDVQLGETVSFPAGALYNAGHYAVVLTGDNVQQDGALNVIASSQPAHISFLAKPSRLPIGLHNGISGTVYVFDAYHNLISAPTPVSFQLANPGGATQERTLTAQNGVASTQMDSTEKEGFDKFVAHAGSVTSTRVIEQVPGDPCSLHVSATPAGKLIELKTDPVRDCSGNAIPEGTIVTFTENYNGTQTTVDVPLKHGMAQVDMPADRGAKISVASGVVLGNEIHWDR